MAIGSEPEVGVRFTRWGEMSESDRLAWFFYIRHVWSADLQGGYGKVCYPSCRSKGEYD